MKELSKKIAIGAWSRTWSIIALIFGSIYGACKDATLRYFEFVWSVIEKEPRWYVRMFSYLLFIFTPIPMLATPVALFLTIASVFIAVDQAFYPIAKINPAYAAKENSKLSLDEKSALLFDAASHQMRMELNSLFGWTPNDIMISPTKFFDNKLNKQLGVRNATRQAVILLSKKITNYGPGDTQNKDTLEASSKLGFSPDAWNAWVSDSEGEYDGAIKLLDKYMREARASKSTNMSNITTSDIHDILVGIVEEILNEPYGRLSERNDAVEWSQLDDIIYYATGSAAIARDMLLVMQSAFNAEVSKGSDANLKYAIESLDAAAQYNPWWVTRGEGDSKPKDDRAKLAQYYAQAIKRIEDTVKAINR